MEDRIEPLSDPGAKEAKKSHTGVTAFGTARATNDLACNDQWVHAALCEIVVRGHAWQRHKDKEFR